MRYQRLAAALLIGFFGAAPFAAADDRDTFRAMLDKLQHAPISRPGADPSIAPATDEQMRQARSEEREGGIPAAEAEALIRGAGFVCNKARRIWQIPRLRDGSTNVVCDSDRPGKEYQFEIRDYGGRIIVRALQS